MKKIVTRSLAMGVMLLLTVILSGFAQPQPTIVTEQVAIDGYTLPLPQIRGMEDQTLQLGFNTLVKNSVGALIHQSSYDFDSDQVKVWSAPGSLFQQGAITSFGVNISTYINKAAHPNNQHITFTINTDSGQIYKLGDLFAGNAYQEKLPLLLRKQLSQKPFRYFAAPDIRADSINFYLTTEGLVIYFQQGEIAAYACGLIECVLPYPDIADIMAPDVLKKLKNK